MDGGAPSKRKQVALNREQVMPTGSQAAAEPLTSGVNVFTSASQALVDARVGFCSASPDQDEIRFLSRVCALSFSREGTLALAWTWRNPAHRGGQLSTFIQQNLNSSPGKA
ncbi:hypothetical protein D623_10003877 [Myotis brandtii]|uniref:Uncharacterized protein n=1 Tax=Myotis brandtii TaxID=109478 RepID=S7P3F9_MYOBR|nr:hypothetical protein D623_10003877 [Myotis brandtii]